MYARTLCARPVSALADPGRAKIPEGGRFAAAASSFISRPRPFDDHGRVMIAISYNSDIGDAWEYADDPYYPEKFSGLAIRIGVNYILYAMTH